MRPVLRSIALLSTLAFVSPISAQTAGLELQAGLGYARAFDGGGPSFTAAVERPLSAPTRTVQHAVGGGLWYSHMSIASGYTAGRHLMGLGVRYQMEIRAGRARPFLAVPVQVLRSSIPERATLQPASFSTTRVPNPGLPTPVEDVMGSDWGWGAGLELGLRVGLSSQFSAQTSVQGLYQRIYEAGSRNGAWTIHGGITYQP